MPCRCHITNLPACRGLAGDDWPGLVQSDQGWNKSKIKTYYHHIVDPADGLVHDSYDTDTSRPTGYAPYSTGWSLSFDGTALPNLGLGYTRSPTDLAINGNGFFMVRGANDTPYLTRAGSFVPNSAGELVNAGGYKLLGYNLASGDLSSIVNSAAGLEVVGTANLGLKATPSTAANMQVNLPSNAAITAAANLPSTNSAGAVYTDEGGIVLESLRPAVPKHWRPVDPVSISVSNTAANIPVAIYGGHFHFGWGHLLFETLPSAFLAHEMPDAPVLFVSAPLTQSRLASRIKGRG